MNKGPKTSADGKDPYEALAEAIILQAVKDWRRAKEKLRKYPSAWGARQRKMEVESFFLSDWFHDLSDADGGYILKILKEEEQ